MKKLDRVTVEGLEIKAPGVYPVEAKVLYGLVRSGDIFIAFDYSLSLWILREFQVTPGCGGLYEEAGIPGKKRNHTFCPGEWIFYYRTGRIWIPGISVHVVLQDVPAELKKKLLRLKGETADEMVLFDFTSLADKLGFVPKRSISYYCEI
ncbi:uncharacterized protein BCR38DRAFT_405347 [Pseudomassariella vexata]|uniref:Uncharacterized protein n=1 Tax=Pseudomassariella vexata TaxID=1141098 RepID=A0A1Y2EDJ2_9PEZI|nr:uncharacterized protein BCR38DRAFT_405347 [Pseudomassariella vexata]ORY69649.1 hypothetical protein BCR38DRAFT_405347 [Pseudomassariella vexata]